MFSFRRDKVGFFATLILLTIFGSTVIATMVLLVVGVVQGDWKEFLLPVKWILGTGWVLCIVTVLIRVYIFRHQWLKARRLEAEAQTSGDRQQPPPS